MSKEKKKYKRKKKLFLYWNLELRTYICQNFYICSGDKSEIKLCWGYIIRKWNKRILQPSNITITF